MSLGKFDGVSDSNISKIIDQVAANIGKVGGNDLVTELVNLIPLMTSNTTPSGVASASSEYFAAYKAMDGDVGTYWCSSGNAPQYLGYGFIEDKTVVSYTITYGNASAGCAKDFYLQGSELSSSEFVTVDNQSDITDWTSLTHTFVLSVPQTYKYWRLYISATVGGGWVPISTFQLNGY